MNTPMETNPILLSFPDRFETERLIIRAPEWGDGERINEAILESVEELKPWLPFARNIPAEGSSAVYGAQRSSHASSGQRLVTIGWQQRIASNELGSQNLRNRLLAQKLPNRARSHEGSS